MTPEVKDALVEWLAGIGVGLLPLVAHAIIQFAINSTARVDGNWAIDWSFLTIATSATSLLSVFSRYRKGAHELIRGRSAPALIVLTVLFLVSASVLYAIVASGLSGEGALPLSVGLFIGAAAVSLYFEMTLAARAAPGT